MRGVLSMATLGAAVCVCLIVTRASGPDRAPSPGTAKMAARLAELARTMDPQRNIILNTARADALHARLAATQDSVSRIAMMNLHSATCAAR